MNDNAAVLAEILTRFDGCLTAIEGRLTAIEADIAASRKAISAIEAEAKPVIDGLKSSPIFQMLGL